MSRPLPRAALALAAGLGIALTVTACSAGHPVSPAVPPELKHSWEVAFNRGDADAVAALYAPDGQLIMPGAEPVRGKAAVHAAVLEMIQSGVKVKIDTEQNVGAGDVAYVFGGYQVTDAHGQPVERGHYVETWRRDDGQWRIEVDINTAGPAVAAAQTKSP